MNKKKYIIILPYILFLLGVIISFFINPNLNREVKEINLTYDYYELFMRIISNNYIVCVFLIFGFLTLGVSSLSILLYNGYVFGKCIQILPIYKLGYHFLSYSLIESLAFIISCQLSLDISLNIYNNLLFDKKKFDLKSRLKKISMIIILILLASIIEVYVSIN